MKGQNGLASFLNDLPFIKILIWLYATNQTNYSSSFIFSSLITSRWKSYQIFVYRNKVYYIPLQKACEQKKNHKVATVPTSSLCYSTGGWIILPKSAIVVGHPVMEYHSQSRRWPQMENTKWRFLGSSMASQRTKREGVRLRARCGGKPTTCFSNLITFDHRLNFHPPTPLSP